MSSANTLKRQVSSAHRLGVTAVIVAAVCALPVVAVLTAAFSGGTETLSHLANTVLLRYSATTLILVAFVGFGAFAIGTGAAWLVTMTTFPGRRWLEIALIIPLAFPAYVLAYAYTHLLDHPGIVQSTLRELTGWGPRDYWFPEIRSLGGAILMLTLVLYPYVYLLARASFLGQSATAFVAARTLGRGPWVAFLRVALPLARPAIAAGVLLVAMETIADFGTVSHFSVQTYATGIYSSWLTFGDRAAAAQLALGLLAFALLFVFLERLNRSGAQYNAPRPGEVMARIRLSRMAGWMAYLACLVPVAFGVLIPTIALVSMALESEQNLLSPRYLTFIRNSVMLAAIAAVVTVAAALTIGSYRRASNSPIAMVSMSFARLGYAVPGGVIAVGLLVPLAAFDNALDSWLRVSFGISSGLLLTGSIWVLVAAYMIRFLAAAIGAYEGGIATVSTNMDSAARVLGHSLYGTIRKVHMPILTPSLMTAALLVFVDVMKELPATLILRPFNFDTLAVQAFRLASDERLEGAAVPSLVIAGVGLLPVVLLCRRVAYRRN